MDIKPSILILGGTIEARTLGERLATRVDLSATISLAGRTHAPKAQAIPMRSGGFGGVDGLVRYLSEQRIRALIDATHPYAATMSQHALLAARQTDTPLLTLARSAWSPMAGDRWTEVENVGEAVERLGRSPRKVLLALGRQEIAAILNAPQHHYWIRSVEPVDLPAALPSAHFILERGPFDVRNEQSLLERNGIEILVAKNSGGNAAYGKIEAARHLGIPVILLRRPPPLEVPGVTTIEAVLSWLDHVLAAPEDRGV